MKVKSFFEERVLKNRNCLKQSLVPYRPLIKWAGGKRWLLPLFQVLYPVLGQTSQPWVEPFAGGMALALGLQPKRAWINDVNIHLIHFYQSVQTGLEISLPLKNQADFYYQARERFNGLIRSQNHQTPEGATLFYYLIKTGFNGLCRFNRQGYFNVPYGQHAKIQYRAHFKEYEPVLAGWSFSSQDFGDLPLQGKEVLYVDPPYDVPFTQYYTGGFTWSDQLRLVDWLLPHKGPILVSNQATSRMLSLYREKGFTLFSLEGPRRLSCTGDRTPALEMLAVKGLPQRALKLVRARAKALE